LWQTYGNDALAVNICASATLGFIHIGYLSVHEGIEFWKVRPRFGNVMEDPILKLLFEF
jgi:hypothetical protein